MGQIIGMEQVACEECMKEVMASCKKFHCQIVPMIQFIGAGVANFGFHVVPLGKQIPGVPEKPLGDLKESH